MATSSYPEANPIRHEIPARAAAVLVREYPRGPLSPLAAPRTYYVDPGPMRVDVPGALLGDDERHALAETGWRVESYTKTFWDGEKGRFWQALIVASDRQRYFADLDRQP